MGTFDYHITIWGADFDPQYIPAKLSGSVTMSSRRGEKSMSGRVLEEGRIVIVVGSLEEAAAAVRDVRAMQPYNVDDAECVIGYYFEEQCNLEFSAVELSALVTERVGLSISCYPKT